MKYFSSYRSDIIFLCKRIIYALNKSRSKTGSMGALLKVEEGYIVNRIYTNTLGFITGVGKIEGNDMIGFTIGDVKFQISGSARSNSTTVLEEITDAGNANILSILSMLEHWLITDMLELILLLDVRFLIKVMTRMAFDISGSLYSLLVLCIPECNLLWLLFGKFA